MSTKFDIDAFFDQTFFGLDILTMLGDVEDFIEFSESNIGWQKHRELRRAEQQCDAVHLNDPHLEAQYRDQALEGVEYRFETSLRQRVRYAALIALITTVEWVLLALKKRATFKFPRKPEKTSEAVHALSVFNEIATIGLEKEVQLLESLSQIRNCIVHAAGLLTSYKHESELRQRLDELSGVRVSNISFLGDSIEIEAGFLEGIIKVVRVWLPGVEEALSSRALVSR